MFCFNRSPSCMNVAVMNIYYCIVLLVSLSTNGEFASGEKLQECTCIG